MNSPQLMVEFIEYHKLMGAAKIFIYNSTNSRNINLVLLHYSKIDFLRIQQWELNQVYALQEGATDVAKFAAINDCLYRNLITEDYAYLLSSQIDQFSVPRRHKDLRDLILNDLDPEKFDDTRNSYASFLIRNVFFYLTYDDDTKKKEPG